MVPPPIPPPPAATNMRLAKLKGEILNDVAPPPPQAPLGPEFAFAPFPPPPNPPPGQFPDPPTDIRIVWPGVTAIVPVTTAPFPPPDPPPSAPAAVTEILVTQGGTTKF